MIYITAGDLQSLGPLLSSPERAFNDRVDLLPRNALGNALVSAESGA
jgi:hypothetical protein